MLSMKRNAKLSPKIEKKAKIIRGDRKSGREKNVLIIENQGKQSTQDI